MRQGIVTAVLFFVLALHNAQRLAPVALMTELCQRLGVDYIGTGNLFGAFLLGTALANLPVGILSDRYGSKGLILIGAASGLLFSAVFALTHTYWIALAARFALGGASAMLWVPTLRYVVSAIPKESRGRVMGFIQSGTALGMVLSLTLLPVFAGRFDLPRAFLALPAFGMLVIGMVFLGLKPARPVSKPVVWTQIGTLARSKPFWHLGTFQFLTMLTIYAIFGWLPTFLRLNFGYSATEAGAISSLVNIVLAVSSPLAGYISDRTASRTQVIVWGVVLEAICMGVFMVSGHTVWILMSILVLGVGKAFSIPMSIVLVGEVFKDIGSGLAVSANNTVGRIAASIPGGAGGLILQATGSFTVLWGLALLFGVARIPFLLAVKAGRKSGSD